jgi:cell pole-organizing protein PopZ
MAEPSAPEPTMEEILASIRRIISDEDSDAPPPPPPPPEVPEEEDVLDLVEPLPPEPEMEEEDDLEAFSFDLDDDIEPMAEAEPEFDDPEPLLSDVATVAAASAFDRLAQSVAMPADGRTLEDVVREMLRPLLKAWLDEHLLPIVQAKVEEEVERIARRRF